MFSAMQAKAVTLTGSSSSAIATVAATTAAAPAMSSFIVCIEAPGLMREAAGVEGDALADEGEVAAWRRAGRT